MNQRLDRPTAAALLIGASVLLTGCGGTYADYTEYRAPPVKSAAELRQEEIERRRVARNAPGGAGEQRTADTPW